MGGSWAKRPVLKKTGCNRSTTGLFDFQQTGQLATGLITIHCNWQLQSSCNQLRSSPVASLCTSCQLDFKTLAETAFHDDLAIGLFDGKPTAAFCDFHSSAVHPTLGHQVVLGVRAVAHVYELYGMVWSAFD